MTDAHGAESLNRILRNQGDLTRPEWAEAFLTHRRELFVPDRAWVNPDYDAPGYSIDKTARPDEWRKSRLLRRQHHHPSERR
ncbi:hypothetical protein AB0L06_23535 [Spirillospora sp. NPDC052269]